MTSNTSRAVSTGSLLEVAQTDSFTLLLFNGEAMSHLAAFGLSCQAFPIMVASLCLGQPPSGGWPWPGNPAPELSPLWAAILG